MSLLLDIAKQILSGKMPNTGGIAGGVFNSGVLNSPISAYGFPIPLPSQITANSQLTGTQSSYLGSLFRSNGSAYKWNGDNLQVTNGLQHKANITPNYLNPSETLGFVAKLVGIKPETIEAIKGVVAGKDKKTVQEIILTVITSGEAVVGALQNLGYLKKPPTDQPAAPLPDPLPPPTNKPKKLDMEVDFFTKAGEFLKANATPIALGAGALVVAGTIAATSKKGRKRRR